MHTTDTKRECLRSGRKGSKMRNKNEENTQSHKQQQQEGKKICQNDEELE